MSPNIRVDPDVYKALQKRATPFVDTPNSVLRRMLNLDPEVTLVQEEPRKRPDTKPSAKYAESQRSAPARASKARTRRNEPKAPAGTLLPEGEYTMPLLSALAERGGSGSIREITEAVGEKLSGKLTTTDREKTSSGVIRWQNRLQFARLKLIEEGLLAKGTPRGIWALTDSGRARLDGRALGDMSQT